MVVTIPEAIDIITQNISHVSAELIPIELSVGRVSAKQVDASIALPTFNNSAMDGFGLCGDHPSYTIIGKLLAGDTTEYSLKDGECIAIMTGANVPASVERVIPQENTTNTPESVTIDKPVKIGANIRLLGEDINEGEIILNIGDIIDASHIGLLASQGISHVYVYKKPKIAIFASGNELKLHFEKLGNSKVYNSNTPYLIARSCELGCETTFVGKAEDSVASLQALIEASLDCDLIVTSGGVSVGEADFTKEAFKAVGMDIAFEKIQIKPGKPTTFGMIGKTAILNLPGNPLASALNFELFGKLIIAKLSGQKAIYPNFIEAALSETFIKGRAIDTIIPGTFDGKTFTIAPKYAPGMVNVLNHCNGMIVIHADNAKIEKEEMVKFLPIKWQFQSEDLKEFRS